MYIKRVHILPPYYGLHDMQFHLLSVEVRKGKADGGTQGRQLISKEKLNYPVRTCTYMYDVHVLHIHIAHMYIYIAGEAK